MKHSVFSGIDRIALGTAELPRSARLGLLTNRAAQTADGRWTGSVLMDADYRVALLLTPEHGLTVQAAAGAPVGHSQLGDIPVLSLYGADTAPVEEALPTVDALVVDLPDVGCRYYTYPWTVREVLKMAAPHGKPVYILDRPNPLGGVAIEGNKPDPGHDSAVCASNVPVRHGLTLAELALWNRRDLGLDVEISVTRTEGWERAMTWFETGMPWTPPSPAIASAEAVFLYPGTCLLEGTNVSEGRGTSAPFTMVGSPFIDGTHLASDLEGDEAWAGADVEQVTFTPQLSKWAGTECNGVRFTLQERSTFRAVRAGLALVARLAAYPEFSFIARQFDALAGTSSWREGITQHTPVAQISRDWESYEMGFRDQREDLLLY
ncbi:MAG: DUF1343 domain-containing protein [Chloroflexota bacterium]